LGVLLYELLTGKTPFDRETLRRSGFEEFCRIVREQEPRRPSQAISTLNAAALSTVCDRRSSHPRRLSQAVRGELDWIVMKALEKDRSRRYETVNGLVRDIERYLNSEPVEACPPTIGYRLRKYAERHKVLLTTGTLVVTSIVAGTGASLWYATKANRSALLAQSERERAEENLQTAIDALDRVYFQTIGDERVFAEVGPNDQAPPLTKSETDLINAGLVFYERLAQLNRSDADTLRKSGEALLRTGRLRSSLGDHKEAEVAFLRAVERFEKLVADFPQKRDYTLGLARARTGLAGQVSSATHTAVQRRELLTSALSAWSRHLELEPQQASDLEERAAVYRHLGQLDLAEMDLERAIKLEPENPGHRVAMCQLLMHNLLAAEKVLEHAQEAVRLDPDTSIYRIWLATSFARVGKNRQCHEQLMRARELDPHSSIVHRHLSEYHQRRDELQKALEHANRAVEIRPTDPQTYSARAMIQRDLGQLDKAMQDLDRALELQPNASAIRTQRGDLLRALDRYEDAERDYSMAIADDPALYHIYNRRAVVRFRFQQYGKALEDLRYVIENDPDDASSNLLRFGLDKIAQCPDPTFREGILELADIAVEKYGERTIAHLVRGLIKIQLGQREDAMNDFNRAVEIAPKGADELNEASWYLAQAPDMDSELVTQAAKWAEQATRLRPDDSEVLNTAGVAHYRMREYAAAIDDLNASSKLGGTPLPSYGFFLAMAHSKLGDREQAREWYDKSVKWMTDHRSTSETMQRFRTEAKQTLSIESEADASEDDQPPEEEKSRSNLPDGLKNVGPDEEP
jgi:tetratricopeptide (TPR) repeat protein